MPRLLPLLLLLVPLAAEAQNWPQFRGRQASGVSTKAPTPTQWDVEKKTNVLWKTAIPGVGHSAPIVWGERIYVTTAVGPGKAEIKVGLYGGIGAADDMKRHEWRLLALERKTGKIAFNVLAHAGIPRSKRHTKASHCNSTPATDGKHIVAIFGSEGLFCYDMAGKLKWKKDLGPMDAGYFRAPTAQWGFGSSPVIHDGKVVVQCDVQQGAFLALFDLADGKELWRTKRADVCTWGTPTVVMVGGKAQILVNGWKHTGAYDFATGKEVWKLVGGGDIPTPTPIVAHGMAYLTSGHGRYRPMRAIKLGATGDITPAEVKDSNEHIVWAHPRRGNYMQTPIVVGDLLFSCYDNGTVTCFDAKTGEIYYRERLPRGGYTASPVSDGKHLYFTADKGIVHVLPVGKRFATVAANALGQNCLASPAIVDGTLYFRAQNHLIAVGKR